MFCRGILNSNGEQINLYSNNNIYDDLTTNSLIHMVAETHFY